MRKLFLGLGCALAVAAQGAERVFDFSEAAVNQPPPGFHSTLFGKGRPGDWKIILDEVPPLLAPLTDKSPSVTKRPVLAQLSTDPTDERFPLLIYDGDTYDDFKLTTRFKLVDGLVEQFAGMVFRLQDEKNFYVIRASGLGGNVRFYKVVNGQRTSPIGPSVEVAKGVWHELQIVCKGNQISAAYDSKVILPTLTDNSFARGKIGFWTKSDAVSYFAETRITYKPREIQAQVLVREALVKYPRLLGLKLYTLDEKGEPRVTASKDLEAIGTAGTEAEKDTIVQGKFYYGKSQDSVSVVMPLRDRNGEPIAAVRVVMQSFPGQTEQNAFARARPVVKAMQKQVQTLAELTE